LEWYKSYTPKILFTKFMEEAVRFWYKNTNKWQICILSSASQSFSLWKSYIEKADEFEKYVLKYSK
jgi:UDP-N-acetylmuramoylalanine-D-glutamate ligase